MRGWRGKHADILSRCLLLQACCLGFGCFAVMTCHSFSFFFANKNGDEVRQFGEVFFLVLILQEVRRRYCWFFVEQLLYISAGFFFHRRQHLQNFIFNQILHYDKYLFIYFIIVFSMVFIYLFSVNTD